jgi:cytochrome P450
MLVQRNPDMFPDPDRFDPERWITDGQVDNKLMKYLVSFTRGSRMCLGIK